MKLSDSGHGDFEQAPVGSHIARCIKLIDIGTQTSEYQGKPTHRRQVIIGWELPNTEMSSGDFAGQPFVVSRFYTASLSEKANLRADLVNWRGRDFTPEELAGFEAKNILGKPCMISITMNDKQKSKVTAVMALPNGIDVPPQINKLVYFSLDEFDQEVFDGLSKGIKEIIEKSPEYQHLKAPKQQEEGNPFDDMDSDIPF
jgi:hypothetical protein